MSHRWRRTALLAFLSLAATVVIVLAWLVYGEPPTALAPTAAPSASATPAAAATPTMEPPPTATPTATPRSAEPIPPEPEWQVARPKSDLGALAGRFGRLASPADGLPKPRPTPAPNDQTTFWVQDSDGEGYREARARLAAVSEHAYFYVESGLPVAQDALQRTVGEFEQTVFPSVGRHFGSIPLPGVDGDPRIFVLIARLPAGVAGYNSGADLHPRSVHPYSNEREIIYVSGNTVPLGSPGFAGLLAHELQHLVHLNEQPVVDNWINEGSSELATQLAGYGEGGGEGIVLLPADTQLTAWSDDVLASAAHYRAAHLFMSYFAERFGPTALPELERLPGRGPELFAAYLAASGKGQSFDDFLADWAVANYLDDPLLGDGRFGYRDLDVRAQGVTRLGPVEKAVDDVSQFAARYYSLPAPRTPMQLTFAGKPTAPLLPTQPHGGRYVWWSSRGDVMDSRLTTNLDLTQVREATLRFWAWFDLEDGYDYAYVAASTDGFTWTTLRGRHTTTDNPYGNNYGNGYTGRSGGGAAAVWVPEEIDLTPFAGQRLQLRFEYVTDDGYNGDGFAVDDIEIPQLGLRDGAEEPGGWFAEGFVRTDNEVPQHYELRLVREGATTQVETVEVDENRQAVVDLSASRSADESVTLVVVASAPLTSQRAALTYSLRPAPTAAATPP